MPLANRHWILLSLLQLSISTQQLQTTYAEAGV
jgi:hypothetical protein